MKLLAQSGADEVWDKLEEKTGWKYDDVLRGQVEEKFGKYFGCLAGCEEKICLQTPKNENFESHLDENADTDSAKI